MRMLACLSTLSDIHISVYVPPETSLHAPKACAKQTALSREDFRSWVLIRRPSSYKQKNRCHQRQATKVGYAVAIGWYALFREAIGSLVLRQGVVHVKANGLDAFHVE